MAYYTSCQPHKYFFTPAKNSKLSELTEERILALPDMAENDAFYTGTSFWTSDGINYYRAVFSEGLALGEIELQKFNNSKLVWEKTGSGKLQGYVPEQDLLWTDGENVYGYNTFQFDPVAETFVHWECYPGIPEWFSVESLWTDGTNIYYSHYASGHFVLNKSAKKWEPMTWSSIPDDFWSRNTWTDGENVYYSSGQGHQYRINTTTHTFEKLTVEAWYDSVTEEYLYPVGYNIYTDGYDIYYYRGSDQIYKYLPDEGVFNKVEADFSDFSLYGLWSNKKYLFSDNKVLAPASMKYYYKNNGTWAELSTSTSAVPTYKNVVEVV